MMVALAELAQQGSITMIARDRDRWLVVALAVGLWLAIGVGLAIRAL